MGDIDYTAARFWWEVFISALLLGNLLYTWVVNRTRVNKAAIDRVDGRVAGLETRLTQMESDVRHLPDHDDMGHIHEKINGVDLAMRRIEGELAALNRTMSLINEHLLNKGSQS